MSRRKAPSTTIEPGHHSVDRNTVTERTLNGQTVMVLDWQVRLRDGRLLKRRTQGKTAAQVKRKARQKAETLIANGGQKQRWSGTTPVEDYLDEVVLREIQESGRRDASLQQYRRMLKLLRRELQGYRIADAWHYDVLVGALENIAANHGYEAARQSRTVISRYATQPLRRHRLIDRDPLEGAKLNLKRHAPVPAPKPTGDKQGLTALEQEQVIQYLLALDPTRGAAKPSRGRWTLEHVIAKRQGVIDLTLLQAGAAPRINEALQLTGSLLEEDDNGELAVYIPAHIAKTGIARRTPVADSRIGQYLRHRRKAALEHGGYLVGRPTDPHKRWSSTGNGGVGKLIVELYEEMATELDIPFLKHARSHMWRTTLTSRYLEAGVKREDVAAMLGHDEVTSERFYTDGTDIQSARAAYAAEHRQQLTTV